MFDFIASLVLQKHLYLHMCIFTMVYNTDYKLCLEVFSHRWVFSTSAEAVVCYVCFS